MDRGDIAVIFGGLLFTVLFFGLLGWGVSEAYSTPYVWQCSQTWLPIPSAPPGAGTWTTTCGWVAPP